MLWNLWPVDLHHQRLFTVTAKQPRKTRYSPYLPTSSLEVQHQNPALKRPLASLLVDRDSIPDNRMSGWKPDLQQGNLKRHLIVSGVPTGQGGVLIQNPGTLSMKQQETFPRHESDLPETMGVELLQHLKNQMLELVGISAFFNERRYSVLID